MNEDYAFVTVLTTGNQVTVAIAKSILEGAGITYVIKNENLQDLFALGRLGTGFNPLVGPMEIQVHADSIEEAVDLLEDLREE